MTDKKIKVIIVDDHMVVRRGLSHVIQSFKDIELTAEAESGEEALLLCRQLQPDVVLMDVKMAGMGGIAATEATRKVHPQTQVIALSTFQNKEMVEKMLQAGAIGYILKDHFDYDKIKLKEKEKIKDLLFMANRVLITLGAGYFAQIYRRALYYELKTAGVNFGVAKEITANYHNEVLGIR